MKEWFDSLTTKKKIVFAIIAIVIVVGLVQNFS